MVHGNSRNHCSFKEEKEDRLKLAFSLASLESGDPFAVDTHLDVDMMDAIRWFRLNNLHLFCVVFVPQVASGA